MSAEKDRPIPLCEPQLDGNELAYLTECLESGWISTASPFVERMESEVAALLDLPHAVATNSGTAALHTALRVAGVGAEDEVLVSTLSFVAPANAIRYVGATPVFVDAEPVHWQLDPELLEQWLERECREAADGLRNWQTGRRVKAILAVHVLGHPADLDAVTALARRFGLVVIEDAAEALGARWRGAPVGGFGDIGCFSFNGNKTVTAGGGGMLVTRSAELARRARHLTTQAKDDPTESVHGEVGFNYRLTGLQAAVGCAQLERLEGAIESKRGIAARYEEALADLSGVSFQLEAEHACSSRWLFTLRIDESRFGCGRRVLQDALQQRGIETRPLWQPLHQSPAHRGSQSVGGAVAEALHAETLSLPSSPGLSGDELRRVVHAIRRIHRGRRGA